MSAKTRIRRTCQSCDRLLRKGASRRAWVLSSDGTVAHGLVCIRCALRAIAFVVPPPTTLPPLCTVCKAEHARICASCANRLSANVRELSASNVMLKAGRSGRSAAEENEALAALACEVQADPSDEGRRAATDDTEEAP